MCLRVKNGAPRPRNIRIFYKLVNAVTRETNYFPTIYSKGDIVCARPFDKAKALVGRRRNAEFRQWEDIKDGAIHLWTSRLGADMHLKIRLQSIFAGLRDHSSMLMVVRCRCRPEDFIAWGFDDDVAYSKVEVLD